jgi:heat shock protein HslJ
MRRIGVAMLLAMLVSPAAAEDFPLNRPYKAISISGYDVVKAAITLDVSKGAKGDLKGSGHAGCNAWTAAIAVRDTEIDFNDVTVTKKFCGKPRMTTEEAFLTSLRSAKRWHVDGDKLIIEGDTARLLLKAAAPDKKK